MELVFEEQSIDYLRRIFSGSAAQELTQELRRRSKRRS